MRHYIRDAIVTKLLSLLLLPVDIHLIVMEQINSIDWNSMDKRIAYPLGNALTVILYISRLIQDNIIRPKQLTLHKDTDAFDLSKSKTLQQYDYLLEHVQGNTTISQTTPKDWYTTLFGIIDMMLKLTIATLLLGNLLIAYYYLFGCYRKYSIFNVKDRPNSKNVTKFSLSDLNQNYLENASQGSIWTILRYIVAEKKSSSQDGDDKEDAQDYYYLLEKWAPARFVTSLFSSFSPLCAIYLMLTTVSFSTAMVLIGQQLILQFIVIDRYENRLNEEAIITSATFREYQNNVVKPRTSKMVQDVKIDATDNANGFRTSFYSALTSTKGNHFETHSLRGNTLLDVYNKETKQFEKKVVQHSTPKNRIYIAKKTNK